MKKLSLAMAIVMTLSFVLTACQRSASQAPVVQFTPTAGSFAPLMATDPMRELHNLATQTAMAATSQAGGALSTPTTTPVPGSTAITPVASPTVTPLVPPTGFPGTPATPTVSAPIGTATPGRPANYTLMLGEFPYCIARRFNVNPQDLLDLNGLSGNSILYPELVLKIPQTGAFPSDRSLISHPATYTVQADDTIYTIACHYGDVDPLQIAKLNNLVAPYTLTVGQPLNIP